jgi:hypothetical protein
MGPKIDEQLRSAALNKSEAIHPPAGWNDRWMSRSAARAYPRTYYTAVRAYTRSGAARMQPVHSAPRRLERKGNHKRAGRTPPRWVGSRCEPVGCCLVRRLYAQDVVLVRFVRSFVLFGNYSVNNANKCVATCLFGARSDPRLALFVEPLRTGAEQHCCNMVVWALFRTVVLSVPELPSRATI